MQCSVTDRVGGINTLRLNQTTWKVVDSAGHDIRVVDIPVLEPKRGSAVGAITRFLLVQS